MRAQLASLLLALCGSLPAAQGAERVGDALARYAFEDRAAVAATLQRDLLTLIDSSPETDRFDLYRTYCALAGAWVQVDLAQALLEQAAAATAPPDEDAIRTTLRDQAQFALWELDEAAAYLEQAVPSTGAQHLRISQAIRSLISETRSIFSRLLADQCTYIACASPP